METTKIGVIGCGNISGIYLKAGRTFDILEIAACADADPSRARATAEEFGGIPALTNEELLAEPDIQIVVNLTPPGAHAEVALAAIEADKCVHNEKPLAVTREDGRRLLQEADHRGVRIGCAPDTFLGAGLQTCREIIDSGAIGRPVSAVAFMQGPGPEGWHPDPEFFFATGGGPMFDMGPYYLTALVSLLGPVRRVTGAVAAALEERTIGSGAKQGRKIPVEVPTHVAGLLDFASGAVATLIMSFDVQAHDLPWIEIYGTEATLACPDPNMFCGPVRTGRGRGEPWEEIAVTRPYSENSRGIGVADMAYALRSGRAHRASGAMAYHILDIMHAVHDASREGRHVELESTCDRPAPLPANLQEGTLDP